MISQRDSFSGKTPSEIGTMFESFIGQTARPIFWQISFMALTSSISILEVVVAHLVEDFNFSRKIAAIAITAVFLHGLKKSSSPVGYCGLRYLQETGDIELGYIIDEPYWGIGIATEAVKASVQFAENNLNIDRLISVTNPDNSGSQKILTNIGFKRNEKKDGVYHGLHHHFFVLEFN